MKTHIIPASVIQVRADLPIADCVRLMSDRNVGSVLVTSDDGDEKLVGIFTERDLLRNVDLIQRGNHWKRPIRTVMTKPVHTIELSRLAQAGAIMLKLGIRHLPVTVTEGGARRLVGVIAMRYLFRALERKLSGAV